MGFDYSWVMTHLTGGGETKHQFENGLPVDPDWHEKPSDPYRWLPDSAMKVVEYIETYGGKSDHPNFHLDRNNPFFVYWDPPSPHEPVVPNKEFVGRSGAGAYGDFVLEIDHYVGRMLDALDNLGLADNTIVVFSSDNGPEKTCYDRAKEYGHYSMGNLRGVKRDTWEGGHRLPLLVRWPGVVKPGRRCDQLVCLTDWLATFADITRQTLPDNAGEDSISILQLLRNKPAYPLRESVIHHTPSGQFAIRENEWLYIDHKTGDANREPEWFRNERGVKPHDCPCEFFNLEQDPQQNVNIYDEYPEKAKELKLLLKHHKEAEGTRKIECEQLLARGGLEPRP